MRHSLAVVMSILAFACQSPEESPVTSALTPSVEAGDELQGAWQLFAIEYVASDGSVTVGTPQESLLYFGPEYYFMGYSHHESRSQIFADPWNPTADEALERSGNLVVNAGRYELVGETLTLLPDFAWYPVVVGSEAIITPEVSGDTLVLTYTDQIGVDGASDPYYADGSRYVLRLARMR